MSLREVPITLGRSNAEGLDGFASLPMTMRLPTPHPGNRSSDRGKGVEGGPKAGDESAAAGLPDYSNECGIKSGEWTRGRRWASRASGPPLFSAVRPVFGPVTGKLLCPGCRGTGKAGSRRIGRWYPAAPENSGRLPNCGERQISPGPHSTPRPEFGWLQPRLLP